MKILATYAYLFCSGLFLGLTMERGNANPAHLFLLAIVLFVLGLWFAFQLKEGKN